MLLCGLEGADLLKVEQGEFCKVGRGIDNSGCIHQIPVKQSFFFFLHSSASPLCVEQKFV